MNPNPRLVEALVGGLGDGDCGPLEARFVQSLHQGMGLEYEDAERWADIFMRSVRGVLTRRIEQHRLVQLPEEPCSTVITASGKTLGCWIIYRELPSDPQEVEP